MDRGCGELSFFEHSTQPAAVYAREPTRRLRLPLARLSQVRAERPELALLVYRNACTFFCETHTPDGLHPEPSVPLDVCFISSLPVLPGFAWERHAPAWLLEPGWSPAFPESKHPGRGPASSVLSNVRLPAVLAMDTPDLQEARAALADIIAGSRRTNEVIRQLQAFLTAGTLSLDRTKGRYL